VHLFPFIQLNLLSAPCLAKVTLEYDMKIKMLHRNCDADGSATRKSLRDSEAEFVRVFM
jgi:hypothetical protein